MQLISSIGSWFSNNKETVAIWISIISLFLTLMNFFFSWLKTRTNLTIEVKNIFQLTHNYMFIELAITNNSEKQVVIQSLELLFNDKEKGLLHDVRQVITSKEIIKGVKDVAYTTSLPRIVGPLNSDRNWYRFNFEQNPIQSVSKNTLKIKLLCNGGKVIQNVTIPEPLTKDKFFEKI